MKLCLGARSHGLGALLAVSALLATTSGCSSLSFHPGAMPGEPRGAKFATVEGARVRYEDVGSGPPVVMVHGFASSLENWATVAPVVAKGHRVLSMDLKGFGWTDRPEGDYSPVAQARIVLGLMHQRGIDRAAVVAHSWGSSIALQMAMLAPERVSRLALYDAWVYEEQLPTFFLMARADVIGEFLFSTWYTERTDERISFAFYDKEKFVTEPFVELVDKALERPGTVAAALAATRGQTFGKWQERYKTIQQPALLLWGREDEVTLLSFGERLSKDLPHAKMIVYPRCGHFPMLEVPSQSNRDLLAFLDEESSEPAPAPSKRETPKKTDDGRGEE
jgi:pimeloyl-ACP methyl ester carboxylesterase